MYISKKTKKSTDFKVKIIKYEINGIICVKPTSFGVFLIQCHIIVAQASSELECKNSSRNTQSVVLFSVQLTHLGLHPGWAWVKTALVVLGSNGGQSG